MTLLQYETLWKSNGNLELSGNLAISSAVVRVNVVYTAGSYSFVNVSGFSVHSSRRK